MSIIFFNSLFFAVIMELIHMKTLRCAIQAHAGNKKKLREKETERDYYSLHTTVRIA